MAASSNPTISTQVILRPASGRAIDGQVPITAENVAEFAPAPSAAARAQEAFRSKGFEVGPVVGVSFSAAGPLRAFEELLGMRIRPGKDGTYDFVAKGKGLGHELSGEKLPEELRDAVQSIVFTRPPDFGPTNY